MFKRVVCVLCMLLLLAPLAAADEPQAVSYDFDLTFSLNPEAFPAVSRTRAKGYAQMAERLQLQGNIIWCESKDSLELNATLFFKDKPDVAIPFRVFGMPSRLYITSPAINNEIIMLNMPAFLEFARKVDEQMNVPLPYLAFLYPVTTEYPFTGLHKIWRREIGAVSESCSISPDQIDEVASQWDDELQENEYLILWVSSLAAYSDARDAVETEFSNLPYYPKEYVTGGKPLTVTVSDGTETWTNDAGRTLYVSSRQGEVLSWTLSLPETENLYKPYFSFERKTDGSGISFHIRGSYNRDPKAVEALADKPEEDTSAQPVPEEESAEDDESEEASSENYYEEGADDDEGYQAEGADWPNELIEVSLDAEGLPAVLPADSAFTVTASESGALFPDLSVILKGETKKDGSAVLSFCQPGSGENEAVEVFRCSGAVLPAVPAFIPAYRQEVFQGAYNLFSLNDEKLVRIKQDIAPGLVKVMIAFVAESPTAFVQSLLDDLTDLGVINLFLEQ